MRQGLVKGRVPAGQGSGELSSGARVKGSRVGSAGTGRSRVVDTTGVGMVRDMSAARMKTSGTSEAGCVRVIGGHGKCLPAERGRRAGKSIQDGSSFLGVVVDVQPQVPLAVDLLLEDLFTRVISTRKPHSTENSMGMRRSKGGYEQ